MTVNTANLAHYPVFDADGNTTMLHATLLGFGSSQRTYHNHELPRPTELKGVNGESWKCSACRWFEVRIFYIPDDETYLLYTIGQSTIEGEKPRPRMQYTQSAYELIEMLTDKRGNSPRLPDASARCLAQAADVDDRINEAYVNRAVI